MGWDCRAGVGCGISFVAAVAAVAAAAAVCNYKNVVVGKLLFGATETGAERDRCWLPSGSWRWCMCRVVVVGCYSCDISVPSLLFRQRGSGDEEILRLIKREITSWEREAVRKKRKVKERNCE
jgi:hypothetical protein